MNPDPIGILKMYQDDPKLGALAKQALRFVEGDSYTVLQSSGQGQLPRWVASMWEIRMSIPKFKREAFSGLEEAIASLRATDVNVHLSVIETAKGLISVWLADKTHVPVGIIIAKYGV
jgi:hypothetical protein